MATATVDETDTATRTLTVRWGTSRGADTYGYTTCTASIDGKRLGSCNGGGYDLEGTAIAEAITKEYGVRLWALHNRAPMAHMKLGKDKYQRLDRKQPIDALYGLSATYTNQAMTEGHIHMDGACGLRSVEAIMEAIGLRIRRVHGDSRVTVYDLTDAGAQS